MLIVLDTNVIVSGLLSPHRPPARIVDLVLSNAVQVAFDDRILAEYADVLTRPPFGFPARQVRDLIHHIRLNGRPVIPGLQLSLDCPDPDDLPFAQVALLASVDALVTGNSSHFAFLAQHNVSVMTPSEFLSSL